MKSVLMILGVLLVLVSCEKVIEIDLNNANPQIVVESELFKGENKFKVKLSYTSSFFKEEEQAFISDATVTLTEVGGESTNINYLDSGLYVLDNYIARDNKDYTLDVVVDGVTYSSTATMPAAVMLDSLVSRPLDGTFGPGDGFIVFMYWQDDPDVNNYYRAIVTLNGEELRSREDVYILDDNFTNGGSIEIPLFTQIFEQGDTVDVNFVSIDPKAYDYLLTLNTIIGNGQPSAAPANPNSNFSNNALGYFALYNGGVERVIIE
ncbi:DUF4249 domain-containing protein [Portibacter lacus]|nr:DUF4249 domain-containing protein [Portibacter lacus]